MISNRNDRYSFNFQGWKIALADVLEQMQIAEALWTDVSRNSNVPIEREKSEDSWTWRGHWTDQQVSVYYIIYCTVLMSSVYS